MTNRKTIPRPPPITTAIRYGVSLHRNSRPIHTSPTNRNNRRSSRASSIIQISLRTIRNNSSRCSHNHCSTSSNSNNNNTSSNKIINRTRPRAIPIKRKNSRSSSNASNSNSAKTEFRSRRISTRISSEFLLRKKDFPHSPT